MKRVNYWIQVVGYWCKIIFNLILLIIQMVKNKTVFLSTLVTRYINWYLTIFGEIWVNSYIRGTIKLSELLIHLLYYFYIFFFIQNMFHRFYKYLNVCRKRIRVIFSYKRKALAEKDRPVCVWRCYVNGTWNRYPEARNVTYSCYGIENRKR